MAPSFPSSFRLSRRQWMAATLSCSAMAGAHAQTPYPGKPIAIVVGFAAGGIADSLARLAAQLMSQRLNQTVIVENRAGAGGTIAAGIVAKAAKDGYTLLLASNGHAVNATLMKNLPFDAVADFAPVGGIAESPLVLVVRADSPYRSVADLVTAARSRTLAYGSGGTGTLTHLLPELISSATGVQFTHVPYKGTGPAIVDLMGGQVEFVMDLVQTSLPHIQAGKLRALVVSSARRSPQLPATPTLADSLIPGLDAQGWYGLLAPAGTPVQILDRLNTALGSALADPVVIARIVATGSTPMDGSRNAFFSLLRSEVRRWGDLVKTRNITV